MAHIFFIFSLLLAFTSARVPVPIRAASSAQARSAASRTLRRLGPRGRLAALVRRFPRHRGVVQAPAHGPKSIPGIFPIPNPVQVTTHGSKSIPGVFPIPNTAQVTTYGSKSIPGVFPLPPVQPVPPVQAPTYGSKSFPVNPNVFPQPKPPANPKPVFPANPHNLIPLAKYVFPPPGQPNIPVQPVFPPPGQPNIPAQPVYPPPAQPNIPAQPVFPPPAQPNISIPTMPPPAPPAENTVPMIIGGCPVGSFPQDCVTSTSCLTSDCRAFPEAVCSVDVCSTACRPQYFVGSFAVSCDLCRDGYTPVAGPNPCSLGAVCGAGTYCSPKYCVQPLSLTPQFECLPICRDPNGNILAGGRRPECLLDPCDGHLCPFGQTCQPNMCTCQSLCITVQLQPANRPEIIPINPPPIIPVNPPPIIPINPPPIIPVNPPPIIPVNPPPIIPINPPPVFPPHRRYVPKSSKSHA